MPTSPPQRYAGKLARCHNCRDPLANSFIAPLTADPAEDARLSVEDFERSAEDDAEFGIDHLKLHESEAEKDRSQWTKPTRAKRL